MVKDAMHGGKFHGVEVQLQGWWEVLEVVKLKRSAGTQGGG